MSKTWISSQLQDELYKQLKGHPVRKGRTLAQLWEYIIQQFPESGEAKLAILEHENANLRWKNAKLEKRVEEATSVRDGNDRIQHTAARFTKLEYEQGNHVGNGLYDAVGGGGGPDSITGIFHATIAGGGKMETLSRPLIDLYLRVIDGEHAGKTVSDRLVDLPSNARADHFKQAAGLVPMDSIAENLHHLVGKEVLVRRVSAPQPDGGVRALTFYYPPAEERAPQREGGKGTDGPDRKA